MKVFITKYALTEGILEREVVETSHGMVLEIGALMPQYFYEEGRGWHKTRKSAVKRAYEMKASRIKALENQIQKLTKLTFK